MSPTPVLQTLEPGYLGYFSPELNQIVVNGLYSQYVQRVTAAHETAHAAHATYLGTNTAEDLVLTEYVAWWRDALYAVQLDKAGQGPEASDEVGQRVLEDARRYLRDPRGSFRRAMAGYHDQIRAFLEREGNSMDPAAFVAQIVRSLQTKTVEG